MQRTTIATAIVLVVAGLSAGVSTLPLATAGHTNCHKDFDIPNSKPTNARSLAASEAEIGFEDVMKDNPETLHVELTKADSGDELSWTVRYLDGTQCTPFTAGDCDKNGAYPNTIDKEGKEQECTLDAPEDRDYFVELENTGLTSIEYKVWVTS